jgi:tetratricopeptide (TPR) repeat protein
MVRTSIPSRFFAAAGLGLVLVLYGCSDQPTPEQEKADASLEGAKAALLRGDYGAGRPALIASLALDEALHRSRKIAEETQLLGDADAGVGEFDSAFVWYERSLEEYKDLADRSSARMITLRVAGLHEQMGDEKRAMAMYDEALRLARVFHDEGGVREIELAMLPCVRALDEDEEQGRILRELLQDYTADGNVAQQAAVLLTSGIGKVAVRAFDKATEDFLRALMLAEQAHESLLATLCSLHLATTFEAAGRSGDAISNYAECLKRADQTPEAGSLRLEALVRVGNLYLRNRMFGEAVRFFNAALPSARKLHNSILEGYVLLQLGHCDVESSREKALESYKAGLDIFRAIGYAPGIAYGCLCLGHLFQQNNQPTDALQYYKAAIEQSEATITSRPFDDLTLSCEQAYFGTRELPWYDDAIDILLQLGRYDEAFWYNDRRSNRALFDVLGTMLPSPADPVLAHALKEYSSARAHFIGADRLAFELAYSAGTKKDRLPPASDGLARARAVREKARVEMAEAGEAVMKVRKALGPFVRVTSVSTSEVERVLPPGTALVEHVLARRALYAFVVTNARSNVFVAAFEKDRVYDLAKEFVSLLRLRETYEDSSRAQQAVIDQRISEVNGPLYEAFYRPLEGAVSGTPNLLIVPPRELPAFPLHALERGHFRGGGYLAQLHMISYLPSTGPLFLAHPALGPVKETVALGCPGTTLWDVEYELRDIRAFFKDVRLYFDQNASLATMQTERGDLIHLAVQFHFNDARPWNSYVVLADGRTVDLQRNVPLADLLTIYPFPTVVVSDLDPGRSGIRPAEPYLFLAGGTQEVIFTAEPLSRKTKKYFGEVFYTALLTGVNSRVAYKKAQLDMINSKDFGSPAAWAPFILWGE